MNSASSSFESNETIDKPSSDDGHVVLINIPSTMESAETTFSSPLDDVAVDPSSFLFSDPSRPTSSQPLATLHFDSRSSSLTSVSALSLTHAQDDPSEQLAQTLPAQGSLPSEEVQSSRELYRLPASHPLIKEANLKLAENLKERDQEVSSLLREKNHSLSNLETRRTDLGVMLYSAQQELAKQQIALESQQQEFEKASQNRMRKEKELAKALQKHEHTLEQANTTHERFEQLQNEFDEMQSLKTRIEKYESDMKNELSVARSITEYTETMIVSAEKAKNSQDEAVNDIHERILTCERELEIVTKQTQAQAKENQQAETVVAELQRELELVLVEQKEFRSRWKAVLLNAQSKQDAIVLAHAEVEKVKESLRSLALIHAGTRNSIRKEQDERTKLSEFNARLEGEFVYLDQQTQLIQDLSSKYLVQFDLIADQLTVAEDDLRRQNAINQRLNSEVASIANEVDTLNRKRIEVEESKAAKLNVEQTIEQGSEHLYRALRKSKRASDIMGNELGEVENDMARVDIDLLNTDHQCEKLNRTLQQYEVEITEKDALIVKYREEQEKRHELIAKKQLAVTRINKELEKIIEANAASELDPSKSGGHIDIQIRRIKRNTGELIKKNEDAQREWIKSQARVVVAYSESAQVEAEMGDLQAKKTVLEQQTRRLSQQIGKISGERSQLDSTIKAMSNGGQRMNAWIAELSVYADKVEDKNRARQQEFIVELKEKQQATEVMEQNITSARQDGENLKSEIINNEFAIVQWQQKIAVELETQALLDPTVGLEENNQLSKDNAALQLAIGEAKRVLESARNAMAAKVKSTIDARCLVKPITTKQKMNANRASARQHVEMAKRMTKQRRLECSQVKEHIINVERDLELVRSELQRQQLIFNDADLQSNTMRFQLELRALELRLVKEQTVAAQKRAQKMEERNKAALRMAATPGANVRTVTMDSEGSARREKLQSELSRNEEVFLRMVKTMQQFSAEQPRHREFASRLLTFL